MNANTLVLGPGGINGFLEIGAVIAFEKSGLLKNITNYVGVSVGSIIASLLVCGYSGEDLINESLDFNVQGADLHILQILQTKGIIDHEVVSEKVNTLIRKKYGVEITFEDLYMITEKSLTIVATNLDTQTAEYFNRENSPSMKIIDAIKASISIPYIFKQYFYQGVCYVDGALTDPYPIECADDGSNEIIGIYIASKNRDNNNIFSYGMNVLETFISSSVKYSIQKSSKKCTHLRLETDTNSIMLNISPEEKSRLIAKGYITTMEFIENNLRSTEPNSEDNQNDN